MSWQALTKGVPHHARHPHLPADHADIRTKIANGDLKPGDKLPSIAELTVAYSCSAEPVKMAIRMLNTLGELQGHQGRGVYVATGSGGAAAAAGHVEPFRFRRGRAGCAAARSAPLRSFGGHSPHISCSTRSSDAGHWLSRTALISAIPRSILGRIRGRVMW